MAISTRQVLENLSTNLAARGVGPADPPKEPLETYQDLNIYLTRDQALALAFHLLAQAFNSTSDKVDIKVERKMTNGKHDMTVTSRP